MALSGSLTTGESSGRSVTLSWTATQNVADNYSTISWTLKASGSSSGWVRISELKVTIDGVQRYYRSSDNHTDAYNGTVLTSGSCKITHSSDGSKAFAVKIEAGIYQWSINQSTSKTFTLNTIPRASSVSVNGTLTMDSYGTVKVTAASDSFRHTLTYLWGDTSSTGLANGKGYKETFQTKVVASDTIGFTPPLKLANIIPNAASGQGSIICDTYSGNTKIGSKSCTFTCNVPASVKPTINKPTLTMDNSANSVVKGWGIYVAGYSKVKISATASGSYKSTIKKFEISNGLSKTVDGASLGYTTSLTAGEKTFTVVAVDSRSRESDAKSSDKITVYAYSQPTISSFKVSRSSSDATKMVVFANWSYASVNGKNALTPTLYYKKKNESSWKTYGTVNKNANTTLSINFSEAYSYDFRLITKDSLGQSAQKDAFVSTLAVLLDFRAGGKGFGVGKISETDTMEVDMDANFLRKINYGTNAKVKLPIIQKGYVLINPVANKPTKGEVKFPVPFDGNPIITLTPNTDAPATQVTGVSFTDLTNEGFSVVLTRTNTVATSVHWVAMY